jgi:hypothetical protein
MRVGFVASLTLPYQSGKILFVPPLLLRHRVRSRHRAASVFERLVGSHFLPEMHA